MNGFKKVFAVLFTITAVMLMSTAVFAYTGRGTKDDPYRVTTGEELVDLSDGNWEDHIWLENDIVIDETTGPINPKYKKHVDLRGHTITVTKKLISMYGTDSSKNYEMINGTIIMDVPKQSSAVYMVSMDGGHIIFNNITFDITVNNSDSVIFDNENSTSFWVDGTLEFYNCIVKDHSSVKTTVIRSRAMCTMENTTVTCDNQNSYAFIFRGKAQYFDFIDTKLNGKIGFDVYNAKKENVETYIQAMKDEIDAKGIDISIGTAQYSIYAADIKENMAFNNYIFNTKPRFAQSLPDEISVVCGDKLALEVTYYHAKTCEWQVASITGNKITPLPEYVEALNAATSLSPYGYGSSKTNAYVGEGFDALWICPRISNGVVDVEAEAKQINITKRTISRLKMYKFQLPRHGEEPNYTITFDETNEECVDKDSTLVGYYEGSFTNEVKKPLEGGKEYYVVISLKLKKDYAEFTTDENGDGTAYFGWTYSGQCEGAEKLTGYCSMDANSLFYVYKYTVPIPNDGAGVQLEKVSTGINTPVIGESMKKREYTSPWTTGEHLSKGYSVKSVTWMPAGDTFVGGQYYTALFTIQADPAYYINENTEFYLNDTKVEPISISAGGTPGNTATVSITFAQKGDVNADGSIDDTDAALVLKHLGGIELLTGENLKCADMNNDGEYDIRDAIEILKNK